MGRPPRRRTCPCVAGSVAGVSAAGARARCAAPEPAVRPGPGRLNPARAPAAWSEGGTGGPLGAPSHAPLGVLWGKSSREPMGACSAANTACQDAGMRLRGWWACTTTTRASLTPALQAPNARLRIGRARGVREPIKGSPCTTEGQR